MLCPICGSSELEHGIHAVSYSCKGQETTFFLEGDECPLCGEIILSKEKSKVFDKLAKQFDHSINA